MKRWEPLRQRNDMLPPGQEPLPTFTIGDKQTLAMMRFITRSLFLVSVCGAMFAFLMVITNHKPFANLLIAAFLAGGAYGMAWLMAQYNFGLFWHRHIERKS